MQLGTATRMLVLTCALWGLSFPTIKALTLAQLAALPDASTWFLAAATLVTRFAVAAPITLLIVLIVRRRLKFPRRELEQGLLVGVFGGLGMLAQVDGLAYTTASTSAFLTQGTVLFIPLTLAIWQRRLPSARVAVCCVLALVGIAVLADFRARGIRIGRGEAETLLAAASFTGQILALDAARYRGTDALVVSFVMFTTIGVICLPLLWLTGGGSAAAFASFSAPSSWLLVAILIGPCTLLAFLWMNRWQPEVSATTAGLVYCFEPVFASLFALFLPAWLSLMTGLVYANERLTTHLVVGGGLILLANVFMHVPRAGPERT